MPTTSKQPEITGRVANRGEEGTTNSLYITTSFAGTQIAARTLTASGGIPQRFRHQSDTPASSFRLGTTAEADVALCGVPSPAFSLIELRGHRFVLRFAAHWRGWLSTPEGTCTLRDLIDRGAAACSEEPGVFETVLPWHGTLRLEWGTVHICVRPERLPTVIPGPPLQLATHPLLRPLCAASVLVLGLLFALSQLPVTETYLEESEIAETQRLVQLQSEALKTERTKNAPASTKPKQEQLAKISPTSRTSIPRETLSSVSHPASEAPLYDPPKTRAEAVSRARNAGILALIPGAGGLGSAEFDAFVKSIAFDSSAENTKSYGTLAPHDLDKAAGGWGHGIRKMGPGSGDGKDYGTVKSGGYELGTGKWLQGLALFEANALTRPHKAKRPALSAEAEAIMNSGVKYDVIRGQLGLRKRKLRRCFEEDETRDMGPPSQLRMAFSISAEGAVEDAEAADIAESGIRSCVEKTLLSIHFPKPENGKSVRVEGFSLRI